MSKKKSASKKDKLEPLQGSSSSKDNANLANSDSAVSPLSHEGGVYALQGFSPIKSTLETGVLANSAIFTGATSDSALSASSDSFHTFSEYLHPKPLSRPSKDLLEEVVLGNYKDVYKRRAASAYKDLQTIADFEKRIEPLEKKFLHFTELQEQIKKEQESIRLQQEETQKNVSFSVTEVTAAVDKAKREIKEAKKDINEAKVKFVEVLALLAGFFTFISVSFQIFSKVENLFAAMVLLLLLLGCITFFALTIDILLVPQKVSRNWLHSFYLIITFTLIALSMGLAIKYDIHLSVLPEKNREKIEVNVTVPENKTTAPQLLPQQPLEIKPDTTTQ